MENIENKTEEEIKKEQEEKERKKKRRRRIIFTIIAIIIIIIIILLLLRSCNDDNSTPPDTTQTDQLDDTNPDSDWFDDGAQSGLLPNKTEKEIQDELNRIVNEGMFNISIAPIINFRNGQSAGIARIENVPSNHYNMKVVITLDDTGEVIYESKGIKPNSYVYEINLSRNLPKGTYAATATFSAYKEDLSYVGEAAAKIKVIVEN